MNTVQALLNMLEAAPLLVVSLVLETPESLRKRRPAPGAWSVHELACHLADVHELFTTRLERMLAEDNPLLVPFSPDTDQTPDYYLTLDLDDCLERYVIERKALVERLRLLPPSAWGRSARHPEYAEYSIFIMFRHLALHDLSHAYEIEALRLKKDWE